MKILPNHYSLRYLIYWFLGIGFLLMSFFSNAVEFCFRVHAALLVLALVFIFVPIRLSSNSTKLNHKLEIKCSFFKCLGLTWLLQLSLFLSFYTICHLVGINMPLPPDPMPLFQITLPILSETWALFPWGVYALVAAGLVYLRQVKQKTSMMSTVVEPLFKNKIGDMISLSADVLAKIAMTFALAVTLGLIGMEFMGLIGGGLQIPCAYGPRIDIFLAILLIFSWSKGDAIGQYLKLLSRKHILPAAMIVVFFLILFVAGILGLSLFIGSLSPKFTPNLSRVLDVTSSNGWTVWFIFIAIWWLSWTPLVSGWLAYVWRGYHFRTLIVWMMPLPLGIGVLSHFHFFWQLPFTLNASLWNLIPAALSLFLLCALFLRPRTSMCIWKATLPLVLNDYQHVPHTFLKRLLQITVLVMSFYWAGGIQVVGWAYFSVLAIALFFIVGAGVAAFLQIVRFFCSLPRE